MVDWFSLGWRSFTLPALPRCAFTSASAAEDLPAFQSARKRLIPCSPAALRSATGPACRSSFAANKPDGDIEGMATILAYPVHGVNHFRCHTPKSGIFEPWLSFKFSPVRTVRCKVLRVRYAFLMTAKLIFIS